MRMTIEQKIFLTNSIIKDAQESLQALQRFAQIAQYDSQESQKTAMAVEAQQLTIRAFELLKEELIDAKLQRDVRKQYRREHKARELTN